MKISKIETHKPNETVIEILEDLLEKAKQGKVQGIAIAGSDEKLQTFNVFELGVCVMALVGEAHILARDMIDCCVDIRMPPCDRG